MHWCKNIIMPFCHSAGSKSQRSRVWIFKSQTNSWYTVEKLFCTCFHELTILFFRVFTSFSKTNESSCLFAAFFFDNAICWNCSGICENLEFGIRKIIMRTLKNSFWIPPVFWWYMIISLITLNVVQITKYDNFWEKLRVSV